MKCSRFSEEQIIGILKEQEAGAATQAPYTSTVAEPLPLGWAYSILRSLNTVCFNSAKALGWVPNGMTTSTTHARPPEFLSAAFLVAALV